MELENIRCLAVLGLSRSGLPAVLLARRRLPAARIFGLDEGDGPSADTRAGLVSAGVTVHCGPEVVLPDEVDVLVKSPGVPDSSPLVQATLRRGVALWSEIELASRFLPNSMVGITGTNGKTTTTELTGAIFRAAGMPVAVGGNLGNALSEMPGLVAPEATIVAELSSFQLEHIEHFRADVAVLLNLTEDHLDRHGSYRAYVDAKLRIFANQTGDDVALLNADDPGVLAEEASGALGGGRRAWFSACRGYRAHDLVAGVDDDGALWLESHGQHVPLCRSSELALKGIHNLQNSLAAAGAAVARGVPAAAVVETLRTFKGVPHRLQVAGVVAGVTYINDSKATNTDATLKALTAYSGAVHLILGGYDKDASYDDLAAATEGLVKEVLLIGDTAARLAEAFASQRVLKGQAATAYVVCGDLAAAVAAASRVATAGDVVMLSPACASWDQYRDYIARGEHFLQLVDEMQGAGAG